jgi:hypothetical protein
VLVVAFWEGDGRGGSGESFLNKKTKVKQLDLSPGEKRCSVTCDYVIIPLDFDDAQYAG